jgi:2-dehydropantoate 2-reductase
MRFAVLGGGAMGSLFGGRLAADGADVTVVHRGADHVRAIRRDGLTVETPDGDARTVNLAATTDPDDPGDVDVVLVLVKSTDTREAVTGAASLLRGADVLTLQNGLGNPEAIAEVVEEEAVLAGVTAQGATFLGPGRVRHAGRGPTRIGRYFAGDDGTVEAIADRFTAAGIKTAVADDVRVAVWEKVLVNVGVNAATALARVPNGHLADTDPGRRLLESAVSEAAAVARAEGRPVREDAVEHTIAIAEETAANHSSMRQDVERGRTTEIETINGAVVERAADHGIDVPVNRTLADLVRLAEAGYGE